jgi:hypothetical protein
VLHVGAMGKALHAASHSPRLRCPTASFVHLQVECGCDACSGKPAAGRLFTPAAWEAHVGKGSSKKPRKSVTVLNVDGVAGAPVGAGAVPVECCALAHTTAPNTVVVLCHAALWARVSVLRGLGRHVAEHA